jgi:hypothetical protein
VIEPFSTASRPALGSTQPPIEWAPRTVSPGVTRQGCEVDHSRPFGAEIKNDAAISPFPICLHDVVLIKQRENFTFLPLLA